LHQTGRVPLTGNQPAQTSGNPREREQAFEVGAGLIGQLLETNAP
jgi:hypothetical protein